MSNKNIKVEALSRTALIEKYGEKNLKKIDVPVDDSESNFVECTVLVPTRNIMGQFQKWQEINPKKASEILVKGCVLTNREIIEKDDFMFNTTVGALSELIPMGQARIKKF